IASRSRTSRGEASTRPVSIRLILEAEHSSRAATSSQVSSAASRSRLSSEARRRRRTVGLIYPSRPVVHIVALILLIYRIPADSIHLGPDRAFVLWQTSRKNAAGGSLHCAELPSRSRLRRPGERRSCHDAPVPVR